MNALKKYEEAKKSLNEFRAWRDQVTKTAQGVEINITYVDVYADKKGANVQQMPSGAEKVIEQWLKEELEKGHFLGLIETRLQQSVIEEGSKLKTELIEFLATDLGPTVRGLA